MSGSGDNVRSHAVSPDSGPAEILKSFVAARRTKVVYERTRGMAGGPMGFGLGVAPSGAATAAKPRRWRAWKSPGLAGPQRLAKRTGVRRSRVHGSS